MGAIITRLTHSTRFSAAAKLPGLVVSARKSRFSPGAISITIIIEAMAWFLLKPLCIQTCFLEGFAARRSRRVCSQGVRGGIPQAYSAVRRGIRLGASPVDTPGYIVFAENP